MTTFTLDLSPLPHYTDEQFEKLCQANPDLKFERTSRGELVIVAPTGGISGCRNADLMIDIGNWNRRTQLGVVFDSSTCFRFPNGAMRSPDVTWIRTERWQSLSLEQQQKFPPIAPDFVLELRSLSDGLAMLQAKMQEYLDNGVRLGWLIDPLNRSVEVYRPGSSVEVLEAPATISDTDVLPGLSLGLAWLWG
ncbi:Uma2 family endonuclease [Synechococcus sp. PCC 6312]|uniref:Uma2 family endonuclease n=1 Tax=Synechococcus sp. (strain ATCC 27167 / PCC 6312) TaxID=195253 RepID=UPI00029F199B|nr:Uma2 family endonuclease [Synechococcus sp. PCC 6312]AFY60305.1 hypothetical protein Syn6312_1115 [Synechococcus sp. PCC 6312]